MMVDIVLLDNLTEREMQILQFVAAGLSNQAIANRLNISAETVKWHNKQVFSKLGAKNRTQAVAHARRLGVLVEDAYNNNLPQDMTPFIGRERELRQLAEFVENPRLPLITLIGVGGVGKTRLAIEAAQRSVERFSNGVVFVPLITLTQPDQLLLFIGEQLQIHFEGHSANQQVLNYLRDKQLLLVLDNFEHLLAAATQVADILQNAPHVNVIATSRERLNLQNETTFVTPGMSLSASGTQHSEAIQLFLETARRQHHTLEFHDAEMARIARICQLVEGMPLAIELAAAWIHALTPGDILQHIQDSFDHLKTTLRDIPPHLRSIRAVFERSWELLTAEEQAAYVRLTIFAGPFSFAAAEAVTGVEADMLRRLIDKSLMQRTSARMFSFHALLRQYATQKLEGLDSAAALYDAHCRFYLEWLSEYTHQLKSSEQQATCERIEAELANIQAAWRWAVKQRNLALIHQAEEGLFLYYVARGKFEEGAQRFREAADNLDQGFFARYLFLLIGHGVATDEKRIMAAQIEQHLPADSTAGSGFNLFALGRYMQNVDDFPQAIAYLSRSLTHYREQADHFYVAWILGQLVACHLYLGQRIESEAYSREALQIASRLDNPFLMIWALNQRAGDRWSAGYYTESEVLVHEVIQRARALRLERHHARGTASLALLLALRGEMAKARVHSQHSRTIVRQSTSVEAAVYVFAIAGTIAAMNGDYSTAYSLCQQSLSKDVTSIGVLAAHWGLALAYCGLQNYAEALRHSLTYLRGGIQMKGDGLTSWGLPPAAVALGNLGYPVEAAEVLALAYTHPASATGWLDEWALLGNFRQQLENDLGDEAFSAAWERGKSLTFDAVQGILSNT
jgi:predicted ATPase/DNA-binding CsgD family transcriptional regulator